MKTKLDRNDPHDRKLIIWHTARTRAKNNNRHFDIEPADIDLVDTCPLLEIPINYNVKGRMTDESPSLDRIDTTKGYVRDNIWIISQKANRCKSDASLAEIKKLAENLEKRMSMNGS